ncbi:ribokinase [Novosphingobium sp. PhB57]|uniref:ribokinase n=1 Tax=Novosphingobium sp. PhB57 TaxID=2485107 RepID=UPI001FB2B1E5|nr:ribokinase [Novosphingobium sp. PhB57]
MAALAVHIFGSINLDIITSLNHLPRPGETVMATATARLPGGKGANQAVAAARMGAQTRMVGAVGEGDSGSWMLSRLKADGIDVSGVATLPGVDTGTAYIAVDSLGENQIIVVPGANARLRDALPVAEGVLLAQLEVPVSALLPVFARSKALRILNAAPAVIEGRALFEHVDILIVNQHEMAAFLGLDAAPVNDDMVAVAETARGLLCREGQTVIVTLGAGGALAVRADGQLHVPALPVIPVDTIGAGDCFCGALAALFDEGRCLEEALPYATVAAALCTLGQGAAPAMPMRAAVEDLIGRPATEHALPIKKPSAASLS